MSTRQKLEGKIAVVTGGASGIGLETTRRFVGDGAYVYIFGRRQEALDKVEQELGENVRGIQGDTTKAEDLDRLFETIKSEKGSLDVVVANAGVGNFAPLGQITPEQYDDIFDINVKGTIFTVQKALPLLKEGSSIILTGSTVGSMGTPAMSVYSASKAAIRNLVRTWALDLKGMGIRVNVLSPGLTKTETVHALLGDDGMSGMGDTIPLGRYADPMETAAVMAFLASDDSSFMTGSEVFVDGGQAQV